MGTVINRALWWSLLSALLAYAVVAHVASVRSEPPASLPVLAAVLAAISIGIAVGTLLYRRRALAGPIQRGDLDPTTPHGQQAAFTPFILNLVLSESVGIYGLVLALLAGQGAYSLPFIVLALGLLYAHRPTAPDLMPPRAGFDSAGRPPPIG